jgi:hypothetical protein
MLDTHTRLPRRHCLKSVQKTSIVSERCRTKEEEWHKHIQLPELWLLVPRSLVLSMGVLDEDVLLVQHLGALLGFLGLIHCHNIRLWCERV